MKRLRPKQIERDIEEELRFHLEMRTQQNRAAGMSAEAAQADALQRFGDYETVKTECRQITQERLANSPARRILNAFIWVMHGVGLALRFLSDIDTVQQCGNVLIVISVMWRLLVYMRLSGLLRKPEALPSAAVLPIETLTMNHLARRDNMKMTLGILSILVGLAFLFPAIIEVNSYWGDPTGMTVSFAGILNSLLLIVTGWAILQKWRHTKALVIAAAATGLIFTSIGGSLHFLGKPALLLGTVFPVALLVGYLRESGKQVTE